ncbi:MAG: hypothetical protein WA635_00540 [Gallionella sp.]
MTLAIRKHEGRSLVTLMILILVVAGLLFAAYIWAMLSWSYSSGERAGWVQKLSDKGYLCKTWEGEMALVSLPGSMPEKFIFTVRDDKAAEKLNAVMGKRVALHYEQHIWLPTSCFGETNYFVTDVKVIEDSPAPLIVPGNSAPQPQK